MQQSGMGADVSKTIRIQVNIFFKIANEHRLRYQRKSIEKLDHTGISSQEQLNSLAIKRKASLAFY